MAEGLETGFPWDSSRWSYDGNRKEASEVVLEMGRDCQHGRSCCHVIGVGPVSRMPAGGAEFPETLVRWEVVLDLFCLVIFRQ